MASPTHDLNTAASFRAACSLEACGSSAAPISKPFDWKRHAARQDATLASVVRFPFRPYGSASPTTLDLLAIREHGFNGVTLPLPLFDRDSTNHLAPRHARSNSTHAPSGSARCGGGRRRVAQSGGAIGDRTRFAQQRCTPQSETIVATTAKAFDHGQVSMTDLLLARRTHITLLLNVLALKFDFFTHETSFGAPWAWTSRSVSRRRNDPDGRCSTERRATENVHGQSAWARWGGALELRRDRPCGSVHPRSAGASRGAKRRPNR